MILSVSRRTDIPNHYSRWFINRIKEGFLYVRNPMNPHQISRIDLSPDLVDCIVFWTKNPAEMIGRLEYLKDYMYYFQFTLTGYGKDLEPGIPDKRGELISVFRSLSEKIGKERVIWRYDPILLNKKYTADYHLKAFEEIARSLSGYTGRVVISFVDLYARIRRNMAAFWAEEVPGESMTLLAGEMAGIASRYHLEIESCAEQIDLREAGVRHGSCIDRELIERLTGCRLTGEKDKNQRGACRCLESVEVGMYDTCPNGCKYCYANNGEEQVRAARRLYDPDSPLLCGAVGPDDKITNRKVRSLKDCQISLQDFL